MMLICVFLLAYTQVSTSSFLLHNITKRQAQSKCSECQSSPLCQPKYEVFKGHTGCVPKSAAAKSVAMTEKERNTIVNYHNQLRANVWPRPADMLMLRWDSELELLARRWADACAKDANNKFYHDRLRFVPGRFHVGQNLAWGALANFREATDAWYRENVDYLKYAGRVLMEFPPDKQIGHYTQMVWATTSLIGCAATVCDTTNFYVCNYAPGGNTLPFARPYRPGSSTGELCKKRTENGLCDCGDFACENAAATNVTSCTCKCDYAVQVPPYCSLDCSKPAGTFCGMQPNFRETDCLNRYAIAACPHLCGICPCGEKTYTPKMCSTSSSNSLIANVFIPMIALFGYAMAI